MSIFLKEIKGVNKFKILGVGSNTLIRDGGFDGIVIKLGKSFSHLSLFDSNTLVAGASALDKNVSNFALENSLSGFEFLSCIPGTIGGGIRMNSGCYGDDISKILVSVQTIDYPINKKAWKIIKDVGCAGMKEGDAQISEKHCNFFINKGRAKSKDIENLIYQVKRKVLKKTGIKLELELQIIGEKL